MSMSPPNCTNIEMVSTSRVTRETSEPRRSVFWVSSDRSWMCRNALIRSVARPLSDARNRRTFTTYAVKAVSDAPPRREPDVARSTMPVSGPPVGEEPVVDGLLDRERHDARGRASTTAARASVTQMPLRSSGESSSPRRRVCPRARAVATPVPTGDRDRAHRRLHAASLRASSTAAARPLRGLAGVCRDEPLVARAAPEQLGVGAAVDDPAALEVDDLVGERDRRHPVGDHQHGRPRAGVAQPGQDRLLDRGVDGAGGVVEDQQLRARGPRRGPGRSAAADRRRGWRRARRPGCRARRAAARRSRRPARRRSARQTPRRR